MSHGPHRGGGADPYSRSRDLGGSLRRLGGLLAPSWIRITAILILSLVGVAGMVAAPKLLGDATNVVVDGIRSGAGVDFGRLGSLLWIVVACYALAGILQFVAGVIIRYLVQNLGYDLRAQAQEKIDRLPLAYLDQSQRGDVLSRVTNDIDNISQTLMQTLNHLISSIYQLIGILAMMFWISWSLALFSVAVLPLGVLATLAILRRSRPQFRAQWKMTGEVSSIVEESFTGLNVVTAYGLEEQFEEKFDEANGKLFDASFRGNVLSQTSGPVMTFVTNLSFVIVSIVGSLQVISGTLTIGGIQAFIQYSRQLGNPIQTVSSMANLIQSGAASGERVFDFLDTPEMAADATASYEELVAPENQQGRIQFEHVKFGYLPGKPVIHDLTLTVERGQSIAIVGQTGAGKTTLVNLLMRFYELDGGHILLDGAPTASMSKDSLRSRMGMVLQDTWLFEGSIEENIAFGRDGASHEDVVAAAKVTGVDRLIRQLPDGYQTMIDDEGGNISAGEKQLLTIARAYLSDPDILILDEATSSVDTRTEMLVQRAMNELRQGRTSFVIAHRLSTIRDADIIIVMDHGDVVETGRHDELIARGGAYAALYQAQFAGGAE